MMLASPEMMQFAVEKPPAAPRQTVQVNGAAFPRLKRLSFVTTERTKQRAKPVKLWSAAQTPGIWTNQGSRSIGTVSSTAFIQGLFVAWSRSGLRGLRPARRIIIPTYQAEADARARAHRKRLGPDECANIENHRRR